MQVSPTSFANRLSKAASLRTKRRRAAQIPRPCYASRRGNEDEEGNAKCFRADEGSHQGDNATPTITHSGRQPLSKKSYQRACDSNEREGPLTRVGGPQAVHSSACRGRGEKDAVAFAADTETQPLRLV